MKERKIPLRKCVVSNEQHPKKDLVRVVKTNEGQILVDTTGKVRGHGAYVLPSIKILEMAKKRKALDRALETTISDETYNELIEVIKNIENK